MSAALEMVGNRLLAALVNGTYQGVLLTGSVWLGLRFLRQANAATRHTVWFATLWLVATLPAVHFLWPGLGATAVVGLENLVGSNDDREAVLGSFSTDERGSAKSLSGAIVGEMPRDYARREPAEGSARRADSGFQSEIGRLAAADVPPVDSPTFSETLRRHIATLSRLWQAAAWNWRLVLPNGAGIILIGGWIVLASLRLGFLAGQCCRLQSLKRRGHAAPDEVNALFESLRKETGTRRDTRLVFCQESHTPMALGFCRPVVLVPVRMIETAGSAGLEHVLRHELAHVRRGDDWANLLQQIAGAVLFFHPAVWWLSRRLTVEREIACDDHVLAATGTPRAYALFLTEFASRKQGRHWLAAPAAWSNNNQLSERINMILDAKRNSSPQPARGRAGLLAIAASLVALFGLLAGPRLVLAGESQAQTATADTAIAAETQTDANAAAPAKSFVNTSIESDVAANSGSVIAVEAPPEPAAGAGESGPRPKPRPAPAPVIRAIPSGPGPVTIIRGPRGAIAAVATAGAPPSPVAEIAAPTAPVRPKAPVRRNPDEGSLELRLERLERLVESLLAREKDAKSRTDGQHNFNFDYKGPAFNFDKEKWAKFADDMAKMGEKFGKLKPSENDLARIKEEANQIKERAKQEAERIKEKVVRDAERAERAKRAGERAAEEAVRRDESKPAVGGSFEQRRHALEMQRRALERQMQSLEKQMQRLEEEQKKGKLLEQDEKPKRSDRDGEPPKPEGSEGTDPAKVKVKR